MSYLANGSEISDGSPSTGFPSASRSFGLGTIGGGYGVIFLNLRSLTVFLSKPTGISSIAKAFSIIPSQYLYKSPYNFLIYTVFI